MPPFDISGLKSSPILLDACILMTWINENDQSGYSDFDEYKELVLEPLFNYCPYIIIHEAVLDELDDTSKQYILSKKSKIVSESDLYKYDSKYITIFNNIAGHELFRYHRGEKKNKGEIFSLAYASYYDIPFFSSSDSIVDFVKMSNDLPELKPITIITFDIVLFFAFICLEDDVNRSKKLKSLKALYKRYCSDVIKRRKLPQTFGEYINLYIGLADTE